MPPHDRFEPESHEDYLCRGKTERECAEIRRAAREANAVLPDADATDVEDAARDYVEDGAGRFYFAQNWLKIRSAETVATWLKRYGYTADPALVLAELDRLAADGPWRRS